MTVELEHVAGKRMQLGEVDAEHVAGCSGSPSTRSRSAAAIASAQTTATRRPTASSTFV